MGVVLKVVLKVVVKVVVTTVSVVRVVLVAGIITTEQPTHKAKTQEGHLAILRNKRFALRH